MDNPGRKRHGEPEPFLRVANRRYASPPPMATPYTDPTESGLLYNDGLDPLMPHNNDHTIQEDVTKGPPLAGDGVTSGPGVENGSTGSDPWISAHQNSRPGYQAGAPSTQVPGEVRQKLRPADHMLEDQQNALTQGAEQRRIQTQQQVGGGAKENPTYDHAQDEITEHLQRKKIRPVARANPYQPGLDVKDYEGREGNNTHITRNEQGMIPVDWVRNMRGARGEMPGQHRNAEGDEWEQFKQHVAAGTPGYSSPVFIVVEHGKEPLLYEGNHRRDAYVENGAIHLPAEIRYFGHSERQGTVGERAMRHTANAEDDPRGELEGLINGLPEAGSPVVQTRPDQDQMNTLAEMGFGRHGDPDEQPYWFRRDRDQDYMLTPGTEGYWESSAGPRDHWQEGHPDYVMSVHYPSFEEALEHMQVPPRAEPRRPGPMSPFVPAAKPEVGRQTWSSVLHVADAEDDWWAAQPDVVHGVGTSPDATGESYMDDDHISRDLADDDVIPENMLLREHAHLLRNGFRWDGDTRYPKYTQEHWRNIMDSDGRPAGDKEGHVIQRQTHITRPNLDEGDEPLAHPYTHEYYPAGQSDDEGYVAGFNTPQAATRAANQLSLWGARHPDSQELLKGYRRIGDGLSYDPSEELPHEKAQRMGHV